MGHYLVLHVTVGKEFERVYFPLSSPEETKEDATERWLDAQVKGRQRNIQRARAALVARIEHAGIARPTSWYRENDLGAFAPPGSTRKRRRR
jgi:hypothetical protein